MEQTEERGRKMTLHMIRAKVDFRALHEWMNEEEVEDEDTGMHHIICSTLGELSPRTFRLMRPREGHHGKLYAYTQAAAEDLVETMAAAADPLAWRVIDASTVMGKPMPEEWKHGGALGFNLRARPVMRSRAPNGRTTEMDSYQRGQNGPGRMETYANWLQNIMERRGGAQVGRVRMTNYKDTATVRKKGRRKVTGPDVTFDGTLYVDSPEAFGEMLASGVGRHKAYGYGMLLLQPPPRQR